MANAGERPLSPLVNPTRRRPWWIGLGVIFALVWWLIPPLLYRYTGTDKAAKLKAITDTRTAFLAGLIGVGALLTFWLNSRVYRVTAQTLQVTEQGQITERYSKAIEQLGSDKLDVRLGGIYALERIAKDSPADRLTIYDVLTAFVRGHAPWPPHLPGQYVASALIEQIPELQVRSADVQAAMTVLGRRRVLDEHPYLDLHGVDLRKADLVRLCFEGAYFEGTQLQGARLQGAQLRGSVLKRTQLGDAQIEDADLREASLEEAQLHNADLTNGLLEGARMWRTDLQGAVLPGAQLRGADLTRANLQDTDLTGAQLQDARLESAQLANASLEGAHLQHANLWRAELRGADLAGAQLQGAGLAAADFQYARLHGAQLQGTRLHGEVRGAYADPNTVWPDGFDWEAAGVIMGPTPEAHHHPA